MSRRTRWFVLAGLAVSLVLAGVVSNLASGSPDGLEYAAREGCTVDDSGEITGGSCIAQAEREHDLADGPVADYQLRGRDGALGDGLVRAAGVLLTFAVGAGLFWLVRLRRRPAGGPAAGIPATDPGR